MHATELTPAIQLNASDTTGYGCQSYKLSQLGLLTHEVGDLCVADGGRDSVSVGARPENKAQTELSNTPFH